MTSANRSARSDADRRGVDGRFVLYVEGPRDRDILRSWAWRLSLRLADAVVEACVILGGRRPARALEHFRGVRAACPNARAICVLDRDGEGADPALHDGELGLEFFTWGRRHIESYLLVPAAILRSLRLSADAPRVERAFRLHLPSAEDEPAFREIDAKRLLAEKGALALALGRPIVPGRLARAMLRAEFHPDIHDLFARVEDGLAGSAPPSLEDRGTIPLAR